MLNGMGEVTRPHALTNAEANRFLYRHPATAAEIAETEAFMFAGLYDYDYNPMTEWKFPGVIPPWGMQVDDAEFLTVTIFPARDGTWRYSGFTPELGDINDPPYEPPPNERGPLEDLTDLAKGAAFVGLLIFGFSLLRKK